ncbi:beta strand repeat-containing protein [Tolypothrix campylonemoides VB511288_2]|uniref:Filamentous hemagglutinin N-terminal domain-containing protein n=3 Tax=Nostocales TaxID=1161 RepID=A0A0C1QTR9_9CYAN|nr:filamentous hemagglutinin N-terminal domain-containing protein [Tolypothrix bouteillei]KAF3889317.1 filamentous hemagglutinin N-terminal domain-containing protein [Tolypothrix bouteillei VB521301]
MTKWVWSEKLRRSHRGYLAALHHSVFWRSVVAMAKLTVGIASLINPAFAQSNIVPDNTLGSEASRVTVNFNGTSNEVIAGGAQRGQNLFHSFQEFNIGENRGAYFFVFDPSIQNILARVTGSNRSNILGTLGTRQIIGSNLVRSNANLFLINPNGIVFGENARLDVGASLIATTANGVQFGNQGNFSAINPQTPGVLTVNPSALFFHQINQNGTIENRGLLRVRDGESLLLAGGNVRLDGGILAALGGRIELGGLADAGSIGLDFASQGLKLQFPEVVQKANVSLVNNSLVNVSAGGGGDVAINAQNLDILAGSNIFAGIIGDVGLANNQAGDITINVSGTVRLESDSSIRSDVSPGETGNGGNINITSASLFVLGDSSLISRTSGVGNAGNININARDRVVFSGDNTTVDSGVRSTGRGEGGDILISTNTLEMSDGAQLITPALGVGNAGNIVIEARDRISLTGNSATNFSNTAIFSSLGGNNNRQAEGQGGDIRISTNILELSDGAQMASSTFGIGNAGNIIIEVGDRVTFKGDDTSVSSRVERTGRGKGGDIRISTKILELSDDATLNASTLNFGDAGNILLEAQDRASFDNANVFNSVWGPAAGKGGNINIKTGNLSVTNRAVLSTTTYGNGDAGNITIEARNNVSLSKGGRLLSQIEETGIGTGGNISIYTNSLLLNVGQLNADTQGKGNAGNIIINAQNTLSVDSAIISSTVEETGDGKGGDISIFTSSFNLKDAILTTATLGKGSAGNVRINALNSVFVDTANIFSSVETGATGQGGDINLSTGTLSLTNGGRLTSGTYGTGKAGNVIVEARDRVLLDGSDPDEKNFNSAIITSVGENGIGQGGDIRIATSIFSLTNGAQLVAVTKGKGNAGNVQIRATDAVNIAGSTNTTGRPSAILTFTESGNSGGNITVDTSAFRILEGAVLDSRTSATGNGGNITINTNSLEALSGGQLQASTDGSGQAGKITVNGDASVTISGSDPIFSERAAIIPEISWRYNPNSGFYNRSIGSGIAGDIKVNSGSLSLFNGGQIQASTFGEGKAGNVWITARERVTTNGASANGLFPSGIFSEIFNPQRLGKGGDIAIETGSLTLTNGAQLRVSTWGMGDAGNITIHAKDEVSFAGTSKNGNLLSSVLSTVELTGQGNGGDIKIQAGSLSVTDGAQLQTGTRNRGNAGNILINARDFVLFDGINSTGQIPSSAFTSVERTAVGKGGNIEINTSRLSVDNGAQVITSNNGGKGNGGNIHIDAAFLSLTGNSQLRASTQGEGDAGNIFINTRDRISLDKGAIISNIVGNVSNPGRFGNGKGGIIRIDTGSLSVANGSQLQASTFGTGDAGDLIINARENISFDGFRSFEDSRLNSAAFSIVANNSTGNGGNIRVNTESLAVTNGALLSTTTFGQGRAGNINITARNRIFLNGKNDISEFSSGLYSATLRNANGQGGSISVNADTFQITNGAVVNAQTSSGFQGGDVTINSNSFEATQGGQIITTATNQGQAGSIRLNSNRIILSGIDPTYQPSQQDKIFENQGAASGLFANTTSTASARGGNIQVNARQLNVSDRAQISVNSQGSGVAGEIHVNANRAELRDNAKIIAETTSQDGGNIFINNANLLLLRRGSLVSATAGEQGNGGNVNINSKFIIAIPNEDSDIRANAFEGNGGRVQINTQGIFGTEFRSQETKESDITASSRYGVSGIININSPDNSSIQNNLGELPQNAIDTNTLIANSCIARRNQQQHGSFFITGSGGLPTRPGDASLPSYSTGDVQPVSSEVESTKLPTQERRWQIGDPIIEPAGVYQLPNGKLVLSKEC